MSKINIDSKLNSYHFSANKETYEIQRGNNFEFILSDPAFNKITAVGSDTKSWGANTSEFIRLSVSSSSVPHFSQNAIEVRRGNTAVKYAGVISWPSGSLECYDFIGAETKDILIYLPIIIFTKVSIFLKLKSALFIEDSYFKEITK